MANDGVFYTVKLNIKRIQEEEDFIDESFNAVIDDIDRKVVGIDHLTSGAHWETWKEDTAYVVGDIVRWPNMKSHQYAKCIQAGTSDSTMPTVNVTGSEVTDGSTKWKVMSLTMSSDVNGGVISVWRGGGIRYERGDAVLYASSLYRCSVAYHYSSNYFEDDKDKWQEVYASVRPWEDNKFYYLDDVVIVDLKFYKCLEDHTSDIDFDLPVERARWAYIGDYANVYEWTPSTYYMRGQLVTIHGILYRSLYTHTSDENDIVNDLDFWEPIFASVQNWRDGSYYGAGVLILANNRFYRCIVPHVAENTFILDAENWELVHTPPSIVEDWSIDTKYSQYQVVQYEGNLYRAYYGHTSDVEFDPTKWELLTESINDWVSQGTYVVGQYVNYQNSLYKCIVANDDSNFTPAKWQQVGGGGNGIDMWVTNTDYSVGDIVINNNRIYKCNTAHKSGEFNSDGSKWTEISPSDIYLWNTNTYYMVGNLVIKDNQLYRCKTAHTSDSSDFSTDIAKWDVIDTKSFCNTWQTEHLYLKNELINIRSNWYKAKDSHVSCNTKFEDDFDDHWELIDKFDDWEAGKPYRIGTIVRKDGKLFKCTASTSSGVFDPNSWELYLKCVEDWYPNVNSSDAPLVYVDFEYTIDGTPYNYYNDVITGTIERHSGDWNVPQLGTGGLIGSSYGSHTLSTPSHVVNSSNSYTIEFIMVDHSYNNGNFAEPYNNHLYLNTDKSVYVYYLASPTHKLCVNIGTYSYDWEVAHNGGENHFIHALAFTFTSTGTNLFVDGVLVLETDYVSQDVTFNIHAGNDARTSGLMLVDELLITKGVLYSSDYSPTYEPRDKPIGYSYKVGDLVVYDNNIYQCVKDNNDGKFDYTKWKLLGNKGNGILNWNSTTNYLKDDLVLYNDRFYRCALEHTSTNNFNDDYNKWIPLDKNCFIHNWASNIPYYVDEVVKYDDVLYRCKISHVSTLNDKPSGAILYEATGNTIDVDDTTTIPYSEIMDLGSVKRITDIDYAESTMDMSFTYIIEVSEDNANYTSWDDVSVDARYIRLTVDSVNIDAGATSPNAHLTDFTVYGDSNNWEKISSGGSAEIVLARKQDIDEMFI